MVETERRGKKFECQLLRSRNPLNIHHRRVNNAYLEIKNMSVSFISMIPVTPKEVMNSSFLTSTNLDSSDIKTFKCFSLASVVYESGFSHD